MGEDTQSEARELTFGEKAVGLTFNPDGRADVDAIKVAYAKVIDQLNDFREKEGRTEAARLASVAITQAQQAQMWAVKAVTFQG